MSPRPMPIRSASASVSWVSLPSGLEAQSQLSEVSWRSRSARSAISRWSRCWRPSSSCWPRMRWTQMMMASMPGGHASSTGPSGRGSCNDRIAARVTAETGKASAMATGRTDAASTNDPSRPDDPAITARRPSTPSLGSSASTRPDQTMAKTSPPAAVRQGEAGSAPRRQNRTCVAISSRKPGSTRKALPLLQPEAASMKLASTAKVPMAMRERDSSASWASQRAVRRWSGMKRPKRSPATLLRIVNQRGARGRCCAAGRRNECPLAGDGVPALIGSWWRCRVPAATRATRGTSEVEKGMHPYSVRAPSIR